ncbi:MAG: ComF family protein [Alphaproteobacteria bacterium]|nr:ComF family protein [Alphaproteobacteria bacterium]
MASYSIAIKNLLGQTVDMILPPRCIVTGDIVDMQGALSPQAFAALDFIAEPYCGVCGYPFEFEVEKDALCARCRAEKPLYDSARAALKYDDSSRPVILGFKHGDKTHAAPSFVPWLLRAGREILAQADVIVPVPLHRWRMISRRYNQAALIAFALGKAGRKEVLPDVLRRVRHTPIQGYMKISERQANVKKAFALNEKRRERVRGRTVVLIDDVYTTGATVEECTKVLKKAGAAKVHVLTLARVVKAGYTI